MQRYRLLIVSFFALLISPRLSFAQEQDSKNKTPHEEWFQCRHDSDCTVAVNSCFEGVGYNKTYEEEATSYIKHDPSACRVKMVPHFRSVEIATRKAEEAKNATVSCVTGHCIVK